MGAKSGERIVAKMRVRIVGYHGPIAQLLHPVWVARNDIPNMADTLKRVDEQLSTSTSGVKLVVSGGGYIEINHAEIRNDKIWKSEEAISELMKLVRARMQSVADALKDSRRDYVIGVDVFDARPEGVGQFAVLLSAGEIKTIAWKSFPVGEESKWLAGFGTAKGRESERVASTILGKAILLVCHDAQAYNHRSLALVGRASSPTFRQRSIDSMTRVMRTEQPNWAFNLVHQINKEGSMRNFRNSYAQIHQDHGVPSIVGSFGYGMEVKTMLTQLAGRAQYPDGTASVMAILHVG